MEIKPLAKKLSLAVPSGFHMHILPSHLTENNTVNSLQLSCYVILVNEFMDIGKNKNTLFHWLVLQVCSVITRVIIQYIKLKQACITTDSPACPPKCTVSSQLQSPTWWHLWCQWAPARRSVPSSYWAVSALPCGVWRRCGWLWLAWVWWSPWTRAAAHSSAGWEMWGSVMCRSCCPLTSWGWRSWCSPHVGRVHLRHTRNSRLEKEVSW